MFSLKVVLWGGVASIFAGLFWLMTGLAPLSGNAPFRIALVLSLGGLISLYSQQAKQGGIVGLAGFVLGITSAVVMLVADWSDEPASDEVRGVLILSLGFLTLGIGLALLGIASLRGKTLPRWRGLPLTLAALNILLGTSLWLIFYMPLSQGRDPFHPWNPTAYLPALASLVLIGIGWMGLGATLAAEGDAQIPVAQPPSAST